MRSGKIAGDANDGDGWWRRVLGASGVLATVINGGSESQSLADGFDGSGIRKEAIGECFRDDRHPLGACAVIVAEITTPQKWNAHRVQVTVTNAGYVDADERRRYVRFRLQGYGRLVTSEQR